MTEALAPPESFEVVAARSGVRVRVGPHDTIADVLTEAGVKLLLGCQGGGCGTCVVQVLEGVADHQDVFLTDAERAAGKITVCCSRALTGILVIDV